MRRYTESSFILQLIFSQEQKIGLRITLRLEGMHALNRYELRAEPQSEEEVLNKVVVFCCVTYGEFKLALL